MSVSVVLPKLGDLMETGTVVRWLKEEGAWVRKGEPLFEMEAEKVAFTVESIAEGYILRAVPEGAAVPVGAVVARVLTPEELARDR